MTSELERVIRPSLAAPRVSQATTVEQSRAIAEVQAAIFVAQSSPRDMRQVWSDMREACGRLALASRAFYAVPNRGSGPSVHLARELARIFGNLDHGVKELRRDDEAHESEIQAYAWEQQGNVRSTRSLIVPHAKMARGARTELTDLADIYLNNQNIGARAVRETIFTILPADFVAEAQELCRATIERGDGKPLIDRIGAMIEGFRAIGVTVERIEAKLDRKRGQWTAADVADLSIVYSSIKRRETTADEAFPQAPVTVAEITSPRGRAKPKPAAETEQAEPDLPHEWDRAKLITVIDGLFVRCEIDDWAQYARETLKVDVHDLAELTDQQLANLMVALTAYAEQLEPPASAE